MDIPFLVLFALGVAMTIWPARFAGPSVRDRVRRLKEIEAGAPERYFEEHRALVHYKPTPRFLELWRVIGIVIAMLAVGHFVDEHFDVEAPTPARFDFSTS